MEDKQKKILLLPLRTILQARISIEDKINQLHGYFDKYAESQQEETPTKISTEEFLLKHVQENFLVNAQLDDMYGEQAITITISAMEQYAQSQHPQKPVTGVKEAEEFIKDNQGGVLLESYTLKDMLWFMNNYASQLPKAIQHTPKERLSDSEIETEAELRYPVITHNDPDNSPYVNDKEIFIKHITWYRDNHTSVEVNKELYSIHCKCKVKAKGTDYDDEMNEYCIECQKLIKQI